MMLLDALSLSKGKNGVLYMAGKKDGQDSLLLEGGLGGWSFCDTMYS